MKNPIKRIKAFIDKRIERAVKRELAKIFRKDGEIAVDHHLMQDSWAIIKVDTGENTCYLKFLTLDKKDLKELIAFLRHFERTKIDSMPQVERMFNAKYFELFQ